MGEKQFRLEDVLKPVEYEDDGREKIKASDLVGKTFVIEGIFKRVNVEDDSNYMSFHIDVDGKKYYMNTSAKVLMQQAEEMLDYPVKFPEETVKVKLIQKKSQKRKRPYYVFVQE